MVLTLVLTVTLTLTVSLTVQLASWIWFSQQLKSSKAVWINQEKKILPAVPSLRLRLRLRRLLRLPEQKHKMQKSVIRDASRWPRPPRFEVTPVYRWRHVTPLVPLISLLPFIHFLSFFSLCTFVYQCVIISYPIPSHPCSAIGLQRRGRSSIARSLFSLYIDDV